LPPFAQFQTDKKLVDATVLGMTTDIDFVLYEPSSSLSLAGTTLLVDDQDELMTFSGSWQTGPPVEYASYNFPTGNVINHTCTRTREPGAAFKVGFVGQ
jgi:hypothetical protein